MSTKQTTSYAGAKRAHLLKAGDIISLGQGEDFTVLSVEEIINAAEEMDIRVDIGEGCVYFKPTELVDIVAPMPAPNMPADAYSEGYKAAGAGTPEAHCPYCRGTKSRRDWIAGHTAYWNAGEA